jgi:hypothetical protein
LVKTTRSNVSGLEGWNVAAAKLPILPPRCQKTTNDLARQGSIVPLLRGASGIPLFGPKSTRLDLPPVNPQRQRDGLGARHRPPAGHALCPSGRGGRATQSDRWLAAFGAAAGAHRGLTVLADWRGLRPTQRSRLSARTVDIAPVGNPPPLLRPVGGACLPGLARGERGPRHFEQSDSQASQGALLFGAPRSGVRQA